MIMHAYADGSISSSSSSYSLSSSVTIAMAAGPPIMVAAAAKPCDGAVGGEQAGGEVVRRTAHDRHVGPDVELVDVVIRAIGLAEDAVDVVGEVIELEAQVEVREAVRCRRRRRRSCGSASHTATNSIAVVAAPARAAIWLACC
jgi:hypothetical protein